METVKKLIMTIALAVSLISVLPAYAIRWGFVSEEDEKTLEDVARLTDL